MSIVQDSKLTPKQQAKAEGLTHYNTEKPCRNGHTALRLVSTSHCVECLAQYQKKYIEENKSYVKQRNALYHKNYREQQGDGLKEKNRQWRNDNKALHNALCKKRKLGQIQRTPQWLNESQLLAIECKYSLASMLSNNTGEPWHVDHIVPLQGEQVCGLHVPWNLRVITAKENLSKGNRYDGQ